MHSAMCCSSLSVVMIAETAGREAGVWRRRGHAVRKRIISRIESPPCASSSAVSWSSWCCFAVEDRSPGSSTGSTCSGSASPPPRPLAPPPAGGAPQPHQPLRAAVRRPAAPTPSSGAWPATASSPIASKTADRAAGRRFFRLIAQNVISITRARDETWERGAAADRPRRHGGHPPRGADEARQRPRLRGQADDGARRHRRHPGIDGRRAHAARLQRRPAPRAGAGRDEPAGLQEHPHAARAGGHHRLPRGHDGEVRPRGLQARRDRGPRTAARPLLPGEPETDSPAQP